jgi:hypothetical protein
MSSYLNIMTSISIGGEISKHAGSGLGYLKETCFEQTISQNFMLKVSCQDHMNIGYDFPSIFIIGYSPAYRSITGYPETFGIIIGSR